MRSPPAGACGGGSRPQRSLPAGRIGLWRGAAPPRPRAPVRSRTPPSMRLLRSATRPPTELCPRVGVGGPPRVPPGGSGARGAVSGRIPRACVPGSPPGRRIKGTVVGRWRRRRAAPSGRGACAAPACGRLGPAAPGGWWPSRRGPGRGHRPWRGPCPKVCVPGASAHGPSAPVARPRRAPASWGAVERDGRHGRRQRVGRGQGPGACSAGRCPGTPPSPPCAVGRHCGARWLGRTRTGARRVALARTGCPGATSGASGRPPSLRPRGPPWSARDLRAAGGGG